MADLGFALAWAERGVPVFPLASGTKRPAFRGWQDAATCSAAQIHEWAEAGHDFGLRTGTLLEGGRFLGVVDIDMKGGIDGEDSLACLEIEHGEDIEGEPTETPSGGAHYFVTTDEPLSNSAGSLAPGVDVRGAGGLVKVYSGPPPRLSRAPDWVATITGASRGRSENAERELVDLDTIANISKAAAYLMDREPAIEGEGGDNHTYVTVQHVRSLGISQERALDLILHSEWNQERCLPAWEHDELAIKVKNAYAFAKDASGMNASGGLADLKASLAAEPIENTEGTDPELDRPSRRAITLATTAELAARPPMSWLIKNAVPRVGTGLLVGPYDTLKSFVAVDLSFKIAHGIAWLGHACSNSGPVLYFPGEGQIGLAKRTAAWEKHFGLKTDRLLIADRAPRLMEPGEAEAVLALARERDASMIVFDTVARAMSGGDENSQKDAGIFLDRMEDIARLANCFVLGIAHTGKDKNRGVRGSTALPAGVDVTFDVERTSDLSIMVKTGKMKDAEGWGSGRAMLAKEVEVGTDEDGDPITSLILEYDSGAAPTAGDAKEQEKRRVEMVRELRSSQVTEVLRSIPFQASPLSVGAVVVAVEAAESESGGVVWDEAHRAAFIKWINRETKAGAFAQWLEPERPPGAHTRFFSNLDVQEMLHKLEDTDGN